MRGLRTVSAAAFAFGLLTGGASAHQDLERGPSPTAVHGEGPATKAPAPEGPASFPFEIGGPFSLVDHRGRAVTEASYRGSWLLVFFGFAQCEAICPVALGRMAEAIDLLGADAARVQPLLITIDPGRETPAVLAERVPKIHPRLTGLTGTEAQVRAAAKTYRVEFRERGTSWKGKPIFSHGSYIYLMDDQGRFATLLPPVLGAEAMAATIRKYLARPEA